MISDIIFCKQETAYEMRISDWSSDVCSSDLLGVVVRVLKERHVIVGDMDAPDTVTGEVSAQNLRRLDAVEHEDRKSVVKGKSVSVRVDLGGRRIMNKKNTYTLNNKQYNSFTTPMKTLDLTHTKSDTYN